MGLSLKRLESNALRDLSIILSREARNELLHYVTITEVRITNDLSFMTVFYTCLMDNKKEAVKDALEENKTYIRKSLASKLNPRKMPELIFKYDEALAYGNHMNEVISSLNIKHDEE